MTVDSLIDPGFSLDELVAERPVRAQLFEHLRLEYCCGGHQTLAAAWTRRGLDLDEVLAALEERGLQRVDVESRDWREVGAAELCAHIVTVHHDGLREAFPRIERLLATVVRVHGGSAPQLRDAQRSARSAPSWSRTWPARRASCFRHASPQTRPARPSKNACSTSTSPSTRRSDTRSSPCGPFAATTIAGARPATPAGRSSKRWRPSSRISTGTSTRRTTHPPPASAAGTRDTEG
jgi:hypothetical protein